MSHHLWGNNQASTSRGQTSSLTSSAVDQEISLLEFTTHMARVGEPSTKEEKEDAHKPATKMEHEDAGQRHEEEKEHALEPTAKMEHKNAAEKKENVKKEKDDP
ncbi:hypothetical protein QYF36_017713 [Acer negundo]|nr:hypothetical protein QYF36_017713 [Acer negundo]